MRYQIVTYDVWGNTREGFTVNQAFHTGRAVDLPDSASDRLINRRLGMRGVVWDGEPGYTLYGSVKRNGCPALELRAVSDQVDIAD
jgi:uncharacterized protein YggL (DUF469 family)